MEIFTSTNNMWGEGLATRVPEMPRIGYPTDTLYYEMQTFYIYYQIGLLGMLLFVFMNIIALIKFNNDTMLMYFIYLLYSAFNPGSFDTTHFIAIVMCCNLKKIKSYYNHKSHESYGDLLT